MASSTFTDSDGDVDTQTVNLFTLADCTKAEARATGLYERIATTLQSVQ